MKTLIAEDDAVASSVLQLTLERLGHEVVVTCTGTEAWETFDRDPVRVVVSDWMMPGMNGLEFCRRVRARLNTPYTYFILLTALSTSAKNYDLAAEAGIDDFLTKPVHRSAIEMRLRVADRILWFTKEVRQLKQLIPICCRCRKINTGEEFWQQFETYIEQQTGSEFSHGFCPDCLQKEIAKLSPESWVPAFDEDDRKDRGVSHGAARGQFPSGIRHIHGCSMPDDSSRGH